MAQILEIIHSQHEMVKGLFQKIESADKSTEKEKLFSQLKENIIPHMKGEEKYFYPALQEKEDYKEDVLEAFEEHHGAKMFLKELDGMSPDNERWDAKLSVLKEMIDHHIEEEESTIFEAARNTLSEDEMKEIGEEFENVTGKKQGRLTKVS